MFPNQEECHAESLETLQNEIKNVNISSMRWLLFLVLTEI